MRVSRLLTLLLTVVALLSSTSASHKRALVIGHRGSPQLVPEHTLESYGLAISQGTDYIEADLVTTSDGVLVARHSVDITDTTDVGDRPEFADRYTTKDVDGFIITGWFVDDFTLEELRTLRVVQRTAERSQLYNGLWQIPTLDEVLTFVTAEEARHGRSVGVYLETKHPSYFESVGLDLVPPLLAALETFGYIDSSGKGTGKDIFLESFYPDNLVKLSQLTDLRLIVLVPFLEDIYADLMTDEGLAELATYAAGVGMNKFLAVGIDSSSSPTSSTGPTGLVEKVHAAGLAVHIWTLGSDYPDVSAWGGSFNEEVASYLAASVDGMFCDYPAQCLAGRRRYEQSQSIHIGVAESVDVGGVRSLLIPVLIMIFSLVGVLGCVAWACVYVSLDRSRQGLEYS